MELPLIGTRESLVCIHVRHLEVTGAQKDECNAKGLHYDQQYNRRNHHP